MNKIELIKQAIADADNLKSKLSNDAMQVPSLTSLRIRHLLNNLGAICSNFLEVGSHRGGTFVSTVYDNDNIITATAIDNYSEFFFDGDGYAEFMANAHDFTHYLTIVKQIRKDCFDVDVEEIPNKVDLYLYDGLHDEWAQKKGLLHFLPCMTDEFIFLVDDYSWDKVRIGTQEGIKESGVDVLFEQVFHTPDGVQPNEAWHNGFYVALLKKK